MPTIRLPAHCDRSAAETALREMVAALGPEPLRIDATGVTRLGQPMLQLLVSARQSGGGAIIEPSPTLAEFARITSLTDALFGTEAPSGAGA